MTSGSLRLPPTAATSPSSSLGDATVAFNTVAQLSEKVRLRSGKRFGLGTTLRRS